jgi:subtilisin family serine protease
MPSPLVIPPVDRPRQLAAPQFGPELVKVDKVVRAGEARSTFDVDGTRLAVAVLDTGLRTTHIDFAGRVAAQRNFTADNGGDENDAADGQGHGTNVAGIIAAGGLHTGMAPGASIIPLKVLSNTGGGSFDAVRDALTWVRDNRAAFNITAVCMSLSDQQNYTSDSQFDPDPIAALITELRSLKVAVAVSAGNEYFTHKSQQGMGYPAILRGCVSVGAVYDANEGPFTYASGASALSTAQDRITPFSQRLHEKVNKETRTDIFAPGAPVTSAGIDNDQAESVQHGTSQAAPVTAGIMLLMQDYHLKRTGRLPSIDDLVTWMRAGGRTIIDGDDEHDNVLHTNLKFVRLDAVGALDAIRRALQKELLIGGTSLMALAAGSSTPKINV